MPHTQNPFFFFFFFWSNVSKCLLYLNYLPFLFHINKYCCVLFFIASSTATNVWEKCLKCFYFTFVFQWTSNQIRMFQVFGAYIAIYWPINITSCLSLGHVLHCATRGHCSSSNSAPLTHEWVWNTRNVFWYTTRWKVNSKNELQNACNAMKNYIHEQETGNTAAIVAHLLNFVWD